MESSRVTGRTVTTRTTTTTRSIRTPLKPANVKDLKAMFDQTGDGKVETKAETKVCAVTSSPGSRPHSAEPSGVKVTSLTSRTNDSKESSDFGKTKDFSSSSSDLLARYRANRTGYYKDNPRETESLGGSVSQSSPDLSKAGNKSPQSIKTSVFSFSASDKKTDFSVPKLNLSRVTSTDSVSSCSSKDDSPRSRSECASPISTGSGSPKLIGRAKPKYLPSPRSDLAEKRVEIPVLHHSSKDDTKLSTSSGQSGLSRFRDSSDKSILSKATDSRFCASNDKSFVSKTTKFGNGGDKTVLSKFSTEVKGPSGTRTRTVEITQTETKGGSSRLLDAPRPWSKETVGRLDSKEDAKPKSTGSLGTSGSSGIQPSWLERKNARNVLSNFVSSKAREGNKEAKKFEREIPIQRIGDTKGSSKSKNSLNEISKSWTPVKTEKVSKPEPKAREQTVKSGTSAASKLTRSEPVTKPQITKRTSSDLKQKTNVSTSNQTSSSSIVQARKHMLTTGESAKTNTRTKPTPRKMSGERSDVSELVPGADIRKMVSRKMSTERFQRLKFDFERGVPTESFERRDSEVDHIELKKRVDEIASKPTNKVVKSDSFKRKEESIFASGLKVSDFVAQVNSLETNTNVTAGRKWKTGLSRLKRSSRVFEDGTENEYLEVGDNDGDISESGSDGIYELVPEAGFKLQDEEQVEAHYVEYKDTDHEGGGVDDQEDSEVFECSNTEPPEESHYAEYDSGAPADGDGDYDRGAPADGDDDTDRGAPSDGNGNSACVSTGDEHFDNNVDIAGKGRRFGVYRKTKGLKKPSFKTKSKSNSLGRSKKLPSSVPSIPDLTAETVKCEKSAASEEEGWETDSNSTTYEPIPGESLYEEADFLQEEKDPKKRDGTSQSLGDKIKAKVNISAQATSVLNKIGNKFGKIGKTKGSEPPSVSTGTDSEMDMVDEAFVDEVEKVSSLSRSSSERSSGKRQKKELTETVSSKVSEDEGLSCHTPPPLPPRSSRILNQPNVENSPPLPPRNPSTSGSALDIVIPVSDKSSSSHSTGDLRKKGQLSVSKDSYLQGQHMKSASLGDVPASMDNPDGEEFADGYVDYDPTTGRKTESVDRREKTSTVEDRPTSNMSTTSSGYIYPNTEHWQSAALNGQELDDEQVYGRLGKDMKIKTSKFVNEPLYQYYTKENLIRATRRLKMEEVPSDDDSVKKKRKKEGGIYEDVEHLLQDEVLTEEEVKAAAEDDISPSKRSTMMEVLGRTGSLHRALWCEMPEVRDKGILESMDPQERKLQEAMFEIITSEASYLKSLNILITVFLMAPEISADHSDRCVVTKRERHILFSNIGAIRDASERFLADLEERWQMNCVMDDICDIIFQHAEKNFEPYVRYTSNQRFQEDILELLKKNTEYVEAVRRLERDPECHSLPMSSFLLLPMQRITRLPLLVDAICHRLDTSTARHESAAKALEHLNVLVRRCNDGAKRMQQAEQMCRLATQLDFKVKEFPLISSSRYIVKQGELTKIVTDAGSKIPFGKAFRGPNKQNIYLFLFNDMMMITKKKGTTFSVTDYCQRNSLHVEAIDNVEKCRLLPQGVPHGCKNLFLLVILENFDKKQVEMVVSCPSPSDRTRWIDAVTPVQTSETERIYEDWDCPQVQCVKKYIAQEPDELGLEESDVVNVFKKTDDNWYEGERIRDGERGWFPSSCTEEIMNSHVRARNLRLRYRLLLASQQLTQSLK